MKENLKTIWAGFMSGGIICALVFFGSQYSGVNIFASIGIPENNIPLENNSLISSESVEKKPDAIKHLVGKISHPNYYALKNTLRYIDNKTGEIKDYDFNKKEEKIISRPIQGARLVKWNTQGSQALIFSPFGVLSLNPDTNASLSYNDDIIRPALNEEGNKIAFLKSLNNGSYEVIISDPFLNNESIVFQTRNSNWAIDWVDDKRLLLTNISNPTAQQVFVLDIESKALRSLTEEEIIENVKVVSKELIFVRFTDEDGDSITDVINIDTGERSHMAPIDGNTMCAKTRTTSTTCAKFTQTAKKETTVSIFQRDPNNQFTKTNTIKINQVINPDEIFTSYDEKSLLIYDAQYNQIIEINIKNSD